MVVKVKGVWVPLHCVLSYNDRVDKLANAEIRLPFLERHIAIIPYKVVESFSKSRTGSWLIIIFTTGWRVLKK